ncbi:MAG: hypothetical protein ACYCQJ_10455 [Nitrososphaerales archaeon]
MRSHDKIVVSESHSVLIDPIINQLVARYYGSTLENLPLTEQRKARRLSLLLRKAFERGIESLSKDEALTLVRELFPILGRNTQSEYAEIFVRLLNRQYSREIDAQSEVECSICWNDLDSNAFECLPKDFENHLQEKHSLSLEEYFLKHPSDRFVVI